MQRHEPLRLMAAAPSLWSGRVVLEDARGEGCGSCRHRFGWGHEGMSLQRSRQAAVPQALSVSLSSHLPHSPAKNLSTCLTFINLRLIYFQLTKALGDVLEFKQADNCVPRPVVLSVQVHAQGCRVGSRARLSWFCRCGAVGAGRFAV